MKTYAIPDVPDIGSIQELADALSVAMTAGIRVLTPSGKLLVHDNRCGSFYREIFSASPVADAAYRQFASEFCACGESAFNIRFCPITGLTDVLINITYDDSPVVALLMEGIRLSENAVCDDRYREIARSLQVDETVYLNRIHALPLFHAEHLNHILSLLCLTIKHLYRLVHTNLNLKSTVHSLEDQESLYLREKNVLEGLAERDSMTGLYNRRKFEESVAFYSEQKDRNICMISADANFLKLTNDIFGHEAGDMLLQNIAKIMDELSKSDWLVARCGGDEFRAILPDTKLETALDYCRRVARNCRLDKSLTLPLSVALGAAEWDSSAETLQDCFSRADVKMYQNKTALKHELRIPNYIMERLYDRQVLNKEVAEDIAELTCRFAVYLQFSKEQAREISLAAHYQDIGMAKLPESFVIRGQFRTEEETSQVHMHVAHGYTMARQFDELYRIADIIHCSHENWDGSGYPNNLKGEDIPVEARIIRLATDYVGRTHPTVRGGFYTVEEAIQKLQQESGRIYDPDLTSRFLQFLHNQSM